MQTMQTRVLGGFLVIPTSATLARIPQPSQRAALICAAFDALKDHRSDLVALRADTILEMRDRRRMKWQSIAHRFRLSITAAVTIGSGRRAELADDKEPRSTEPLRTAA